LTGWVVGFGCSVLADQVFFLSLAWAAVSLGVPGLVGLVLAAASVPRILVLLVSGAVADARSPKRIIIGTDSGRALVMAVAAAAVLMGDLNAWVLLGVAVAVGTLDGFFLPAVGALPVRIAPPELMGRVSALRTVTQRVGMLGGGPLAGWLIHLFGPSAAFAGSAVLFALSVGSLALVTLAPRPGPAPAVPDRASTSSPRPLLARAWAETAAGFQVVRGNRVLAGLLLLIGGMNLGFAGPFTAGIPLLAAAHGWGAGGAGLLVGAFGAGAAAGGLGLLAVRHVAHAGWVQLVAVASMGLTLAAVGVVSHLGVALAAALVLGLGSGVFGTVVYGLLLNLSPAADVGRVMALLSLTLEGTAALSFVATSAVTTSRSAGASFILGGLLILATTLAVATRPHLCQLRTERPKPIPETPVLRPEPAHSSR